MKILGIIVEYEQIQSVYYSMKDNDDIVYYPQVLIEQCGYKLSSNNKIIHPGLIFTDSEPPSLMIMMNLKKSFMKILCVMNKNNTLIITIF